MVKIDDYNFKRIDKELEQFKDDVTTILNFGKYSAQIVDSAPTWIARNGEFVFFSDGSLKRIYFYNAGSWDFVEYETGTVGGSITEIVASDTAFKQTSVVVFSFAVLNEETYTFEVNLGIETPASPDVRVKIDGPTTSPSLVLFEGRDSADLFLGDRKTVGNESVKLIGASGAGWIKVNGSFKATADGTIEVEIRELNSGTNSTIKAGSYIARRKAFT